MIIIILGDIQDCSLTAKPPLSKTEQLILPDDIQQDKEITEDGAVISGIFISSLKNISSVYIRH